MTQFMSSTVGSIRSAN